MKRTPYNVSAEKIFRFVAEDKLNAFITASSVTDIYYFVNKYVHDTIPIKRRRIELIITRNLKDFAGSPVTAIIPDDFLASYF